MGRTFRCFFGVLIFSVFLERACFRTFSEKGFFLILIRGFDVPGEGKKGEVNSPFRDFRDSRVKD